MPSSSQRKNLSYNYDQKLALEEELYAVLNVTDKVTNVVINVASGESSIYINAGVDSVVNLYSNVELSDPNPTEGE